MRQARLATVVTLGSEGLEGSHVPVIVNPMEGPYGSIQGHLSRGNTQWRRVDPAVPALAIFMGADAYITPSWSETKSQTGKVVPTWNYVAVHAYGTIEFFDDTEQLRAVVTELTERHEADRQEPWAVSDAPEDYVHAQLKGIIGFKLSITRLEGKWKMSQNSSQNDRKVVVQGLNNEGDSPEVLVAKIMSSEP
jgi:transcriptional regulator